ncbi:exodeoxyribonuclease VII large subunit [Paludifilum halophilum]|uniref:Exodeoxyribonuclease 7 large subunit n=1 Tax=Paludifilum halophilum TaxID=1642702 RepID=A0A235BC15_9BACL|nr:exodeoxyribonuclease VII large subunit [Paludifilum halophilum]OYD09826.1 exodeoxyribonuclease VII large subunit [Paludifilum halophilum]
MGIKQRDVLSVTDLVHYLSRVIEQDEGLAHVWAKGEISNFKHHSRGHMYFTLKDEQTRIRAVMFAANNRRLRFRPKDGDDVLVWGRIAVYERGGQVQLYVTWMQPKGIGERYAAYEQLKEKLQEEGIFSPLLKKPLPYLPRRVGVITSSTGAAVRDIITTIRRRTSIVDILLHPVAVQGGSAAEEIADALDRMNKEEVDVVIVGRGGGSLEELWAFNEEVVARSIHCSRIPVVSAVGHETDTTIADFTADMRAATPTAAAELVAPRLDGLQDHLTSLQQRLHQARIRRLTEAGERLRRTMKRPVFRQPDARLKPYEQRLNHLTNNLVRAARLQFIPHRNELERWAYRLHTHQPRVRLKALKEQLSQLDRDCREKFLRLHKDRKEAWLRRVDRLDALSPLKVMRRGYSLVYRYDGQELIQSVKRVQSGDLIRVRLADGTLKCQVWGREGNSDEHD